MNDFNVGSVKVLSALMEARTVKLCKTYDIFGDSYLAIYFRDGSSVKFRYDWIYEWEFNKGEGVPE